MLIIKNKYQSLLTHAKISGIRIFKKTVACNEERINYIFALKLFVTIKIQKSKVISCFSIIHLIPKNLFAVKFDFLELHYKLH